MLRIAVTGGIACGKSLVGEAMAQEGIRVCDADNLAHDLIRRGSPVHERIVAAFGADILGATGEVDRTALGDLVFSDAGKRESLNAIIHPEAKRLWREWLAGVDSGRAAAVIVPLLFEVGEGSGWDAVVCVASSEAAQLARMESRGLSREKGRARIAAQMPVPEKMALADYVIYNCGTLELLYEQTRRVVRRILEA